MTKSSACTQGVYNHWDLCPYEGNLRSWSRSAEFISRVTDEVLEDVRAWRSRPLQGLLSGGLFDALRVKSKTAIPLRPKPCILPWPLGRRLPWSSRDVAVEQWRAAYWTSVFNEIKARGCNDILIAVTDGLKGMTKAIETVYPKDDTSDLYCAFAEKFNGFLSPIRTWKEWWRQPQGNIWGSWCGGGKKQTWRFCRIYAW